MMSNKKIIPVFATMFSAYSSAFSSAYPLVAFLSVFASGCLKGPSFLNSGSEPPKNSRVVAVTSTDSGMKSTLETKVEGSRATAVVDPKSDNTQVMKASENSSISGSRVEFPPGAIAIATEVALSPGAPVATSATLASMGLDTKVATAAPSVSVTSSIAIDTTVPFTVALPIPDSSRLHLNEIFLEDPLSNLVVFYNVTKAATNSTVAGVILREDIEIENGYAKIKTRFFGTFQAVITQTRVVAVKEVAAAPLPPVAPSQKSYEPLSRFYYASGPLTVSRQKSDDLTLQSWASAVSPKIVGTNSTLVEGLKSFANEK